MTAPSSRTGATDREVEAVCAGLSLCVNALDRHSADCPRATRAALLAEQPGGGR